MELKWVIIYCCVVMLTGISSLTFKEYMKEKTKQEYIKAGYHQSYDGMWVK